MNRDPKPDKPWNPSPRIRAFLAAYAASCSITKAAEAAGISRRAHYRLLENSPQYSKAFEAAREEMGDRLVALAVERVCIGVKRLKIYHDAPVYVPRDVSLPFDETSNPMVPHYEYEVSEGLHVHLLKALKPELFRDRVSAELTGKGGGPIDTKLEIVFVGSDGSRIPTQAPATVRATPE